MKTTTLERSEAAADAVYARLRHLIPELEWALHAPLVAEVNRRKRELGAVILAHNYQTPEIFHGVADIRGDSLALAQRAAESDGELIVLCGVHFMAETAALLNPGRTVVIPDLEAGCSLADSITAADVRRLRARHPGVPVVTYVNTSATVKAESDVCCTSANALEVVESLGAERVIMIPDEYLARWVAANTEVEIVPWHGHCEVHERFTAAEVRRYRAQLEGLVVLAHPECAPEVLAEADFVGSTTAMIRHVEERRPPRVALITECSMSDNVAAEHPEIDFVRPCALCPHMKRITLTGILRSLETREHEVVVDRAIAARARLAVERMLAVGRGRGR